MDTAFAYSIEKWQNPGGHFYPIKRVIFTPTVQNMKTADKKREILQFKRNLTDNLEYLQQWMHTQQLKMGSFHLLFTRRLQIDL